MTEPIDAEVVSPQQTGMIHAGPREGALRDMREFIIRAPIEEIQGQLALYDEKRKTWRDWLLSKLVQGVHYGYPPGCEPKFMDEDGQPCSEENAVAVLSMGSLVPIRQWKPKPSLYKAGADFVVELMNCREAYTSDLAGWQMLGSPAGVFVIKCQLFSRATGELLGEGMGARKLNEKKMGDNATLKMAQKNAKVAAVLNTYGLADLFTQDMEDGDRQPPRHENPERIKKPAITQPRGERVSVDDCKRLMNGWIEWRKTSGQDAFPEQYTAWVCELTGMSPEHVYKVQHWTLKDFELCRSTILGDQEPPQ